MKNKYFESGKNRDLAGEWYYNIVNLEVNR